MAIFSNSRKLYLSPNPDLVKDHFVFMGRRYFLTHSIALVSDYGKYGMCPPPDRGFYIEISKKEFKDARKSYDDNKVKWLKSVGYLNEGVKKEQKTFSF